MTIKKKQKNLRVIGLCHLALITPPFYSLSLPLSLWMCVPERNKERETERERERERETETERETERDCVFPVSADRPWSDE